MPKKAVKNEQSAESRLQPCHGGGGALGDSGATEAGERMAVAVDPDATERNLKRLRRIEGQVRGLQRMVTEGRYCADILVQVSAVNQALRSVSKELLRNHLKHCAAAALSQGGTEADAMHAELLDLVFKHAD